MFGSGDSFEVSPELLGQATSAPVAIVVKVSGRGAAELARDPRYAQLPAFRSGQVPELPVTSFRPDYTGVLSTLDAVEAAFWRATRCTTDVVAATTTVPAIIPTSRNSAPTGHRPLLS